MKGWNLNEEEWLCVFSLGEAGGCGAPLSIQNLNM